MNAWARCDMLSAMQAYLANATTAALSTDELLRAEWVARVAALDLYVHELVAERMLEIFSGKRPATPAYSAFTISLSTLDRIQNAPSTYDANAAFDLEVRRQLGYITYQGHEAIANGVRLISTIELWNSVAIHLGATKATMQAKAKGLRGTLSVIVERRNKIAHEGDMTPVSPRTPWPISAGDVASVRTFIEQLVNAMEVVC